jgi:CheY-like chemotaxis protein
VYSEVGIGTTVKVYLPETDAFAHPVEAPAKPAVLARGSGTILLVEDDPAVRSVTRGVLSRQGYVVIEAENGPAALRQCDRGRTHFDLVLTDMVMPGMSSRDFLRELRSRLPEIPIVLMSGYSRELNLEDGAAAVDAGFVEKPFTPETLTRAVRAAMAEG